MPIEKKKNKKKKNEINEWDDIHLRCLKGNNVLAVGNAHDKWTAMSGGANEWLIK